MSSYLVYASFGAPVISYLLYKVIRPKYSIEVNCWFCQANTRVPYSQSNSFICAQCDQYNGFNDDGDYNKEDPDRYREVPSKKHSAGLQPEPGNGLCRTCNLNQNLKVYQLAKFVPTNNGNYEFEVEEFRKHLERTYRLCRTCEATLHQTLGEQDAKLKAKLLAFKLEKSRKTYFDSVNLVSTESKLASNTAASVVVNFFNVVVAIISMAMIVDVDLAIGQQGKEPPWKPLLLTLQKNVDHLELVSAMLFLITVNNIYHFRSLSVINVVNVASWSGLLLVIWNPTLDQYLPYISMLALIVSFTNFVRSKGKRITKKSNLTWQKNPLDSQLSRQDRAELMEDTNTQDLVSTLTPCTDNFHDSSELSEVSNTSVKSLGLPPSHQSVIKTSDNIGDNKLLDHPCDISTLSIEDDEDVDPRIANAPSPIPFAIKPYGQNMYNEINFGNMEFQRKKSILRPAKFQPSKKITKTSWVAGGYWHRGPGVANQGQDEMSRSSSQSSGFISHSSGLFSNQLNLNFSGADVATGGGGKVMFSNQLGSLPNSRSQSTYGGDSQERLSVLSELACNVPSSSPYARNHVESPKFERTLGSEESTFHMKPQAESSPVLESKNIPVSSWLDKQISLNCSMYAIILCGSIVINVLLLAIFLIFI